MGYVNFLEGILKFAMTVCSTFHGPLDHCPSSQVVDVPLKPAPKAAPAVDDDGGDDDHRYSMGIYCQYIYINMLYIIYIILFTYVHR